MEQDCRQPVEVLAPLDSLVTLDKSPGTSCFASLSCLHSDRKVGYVIRNEVKYTVFQKKVHPHDVHDNYVK